MTSPRPPHLAWSAIVVLDAILGLAASIAVPPWLVVVAEPLRGVDPTLVDDGLEVWVVTGIVLVVLFAALAVPLNLWVARRAGLRGRRWWWLMALLITIAVAVPVAMWLFPPFWQAYASASITLDPTN